MLFLTQNVKLLVMVALSSSALVWASPETHVLSYREQMRQNTEDSFRCSPLATCSLSEECTDMSSMFAKVFRTKSVTWRTILDHTDVDCLLYTCVDQCETCPYCRTMKKKFDHILCELRRDAGEQCNDMKTSGDVADGCAPFEQCTLDCARALKTPVRKLADINSCLKQCMPTCVKSSCGACRGWIRSLFMGACRKLRLASILRFDNCLQFWRVVLPHLDDEEQS